MTISVVSSTSAAATSVTLPSHQAGDLIIISARRANNTAPSIPAAGGTVPQFNNIQAAGANTLSLRTAAATATSSSHTSGTWTNASHLTVTVLRSDVGSLVVGASNTANNSSNSNMPYPSLALQSITGRSAIYRAGTRATAAANVATPPTNYTLIVSEPSASPVMAAHRRLAQSADATADNVAMGSTGTHRAHSVEIMEYVESAGPSRTLDGTDDDVVMSTGDNSGFTHGTVVFLGKLNQLGSYRAIAGFHTASDIATQIQVASHSSGVIVWYNGTTEFGTSITWPLNRRCLAIIRKPSGNTAMRISFYDYLTGRWTHAASSAFTPNSTSPGSGGSIRFSTGGSEHWSGQVDARAIWTNSLPWTADASGDAAIEAAGLEDAVQNWADASPTTLHRFHQDPVSAVNDDLDSSDQTSVTGTAVSATGPENFDMDLATGAVELDGELDATADHDGDLAVTRPLEGDLDAVADPTGALAVTRPLEGDLDAVADHDADLAAARRLAGTVDAVAEFSGEIIVSRSLTGSVDAVADHDGDPAVIRPLAGALEAAADPDGDLATARPLAGALEAAADPDGDLATARRLTGTLDAAAEFQGELEGGGEVLLAGTLDATADHDADLAVARSFNGTLDAVNQVPAGSAVVNRGLSGSVDAATELTGAPAVTRPLAGALDMVAEFTGQLTVTGSEIGHPVEPFPPGRPVSPYAAGRPVAPFIAGRSTTPFPTAGHPAGSFLVGRPVRSFQEVTPP
jgi:hypothetical protein